MQKIKSKLGQLKEYYKAHPKRFWALGVIVIIVLVISLGGKSKSTVTFVPIENTDLKQTVLATGQVTSETDLDLAFSSSGLIASLPAKVGVKVWKGQVLASLENESERASLKSAEANYRKVSDGASTEEIRVAEASLRSAESDLASARTVQNTLVENAYRNLLNADLSPTFVSGTGGTTPTVTGTYSGTEGSYTISTYATGGGGYFSYSGLESGDGSISTTGPVALGTRGLYIQFPTGYVSSSSTVWSVMLPNTKSSDYLAAYNAYQNALKTKDSTIAAAGALVAEREASLALKKAAARPADIDVAEAQVDQARAAYNKTVVYAPASGTVVRVDTKVGERVDAQKSVITIQDVGNLYVEANINETNIAKVALGQEVSMTLDAFGPEMQFTGEIIHIDPSSTTTDGVVNYKIKVSIVPACEKTEDCPSVKDTIRPGMNANMTITAWEAPGIIAIPKAAIETKDGRSTVQVVISEKKKKYESRAITTGKQGDGNLIEVLTGLTVGEKIVVVSK